MASKDFDNIGDAVSYVVKTLQRVITSDFPAVAEEYAHEALEAIKERTISGSGIAQDGGTVQPLLPLSLSYKIYRQKNYRQLASWTSAGTSNLTFSGEMIESMSVNKRGSRSYVLTFEGTRDNGLTNLKLAGYVSRRRPFFFLSQNDLNRLEDSANKRFDALVRRRLS